MLPRVLLALSCAVAVGSCRPKAELPKPVLTPEATLSALRDAIASQRPLDQLTDPLPWSQAVLLAGSVRVRVLTGVSPMTEASWRVALADTEARATPDRAFDGAERLLRDGHCARIADDPLPEEVLRLPMTDLSWPANVRAMRARINPKLATASSGRFRCDDGPPFRAVFFRSPDGLRVAALYPAGR